MKILTTIDLLALPSLETPPTGHVGFGAKADGLYQKIGTTETKLSVDGHTHTFASLTSKPTTLAGYGITDAASSNHTHAYLPLAGGTMANTNLVGNLNADLLDGHNASVTANTGLLHTRKEHYFSATQSWLRIGYLLTPAQTGSNMSKVVCEIIGLNNFGSNGHNVVLLTASTRGSIFVKGLYLQKDGENIRVGYVQNAENVEIWVSGSAVYNTVTNISIKNSENFIYDSTRQTTMPAGFVDGILEQSALITSNVASATRLQTARTINGVAFDGSANITITAATPATLTRGSYLTGSNFNGSAATTWAVDATSENTASKVVARDASGNFSAGTITAALNGNASTATVATKLGTATVGGTVKPFYLNEGVPTAFSTTVGSATLPVYMNAGSITACTSFGGLTGIGTATPLMDGTAAVGTSTLAARQDHRHPTDTSRAAVGQTMYIGTTAVAINRASGTLNLTGIGSLAMAGALTGVTTLTASTSVTVPNVIFAAAGWSIEQSGTELLFKYNGTTKQRLLNDGGIAAIGEVTAYTAGDSGYSEFLKLSGGKITGNLEITGNLKFTSSSVIGLSTLPLALAGNAFTYNSYDVLHKGNIGSSQIASIGLENGWTIEQTSTALYIKKNGVIKGTFNA